MPRSGSYSRFVEQNENGQWTTATADLYPNRASPAVDMKG